MKNSGFQGNQEKEPETSFKIKALQAFIFNLYHCLVNLHYPSYTTRVKLTWPKGGMFSMAIF